MQQIKPLTRHFSVDSVLSSYKRIAPVYDWWAWVTERKAADFILRQIEFDEAKKVLEVACGTGALLCKIAAQNQLGQNTGLDLSPDMLHVARRKIEKRRLSNVSLSCGDALELPFESAQFEILVNNYMMDLLPEEKFITVAKEFYRVLQPGGQLFVSTFSSGQGLAGKFWSWTARHFPALLTGCRPVSVGSYLKEAGFRIKELTWLTQCTFPSEIIQAVKPTN